MQTENINIDTLPAEAQTILREYTQLQNEERKIREEKLELRKRLDNHLPHTSPHEAIWSNLDGAKVKISRTVATKVDYNEKLLQQRLGEKYADILVPDMRRVRQHLQEIKDVFTPVLTLVGTPDRWRVKQAIDSGKISRAAFTGTYDKREEVKIAVTVCQK